MIIKRYKGVNYNPSGGTTNIARQFQIIQGLNLKDDHVILLGHPRSGNNWTSEIVHMILGQKIEYSGFYLAQLQLDYIGDGVREFVLSDRCPRHLGFHANASLLPQQLVEKRLKIVWILRNPKDTLVSLFKMYTSFAGKKLRMEDTWSDFLAAQLKGDSLWNSWFDHTLQTETFFDEHPELPVIVSLFEDKKFRPMDAVRDLCQFLGKNDTLVEDIVPATEMSVLKAGTAGKLSETPTFLKGVRVLFVREESGAGRTGSQWLRTRLLTKFLKKG